MEIILDCIKCDKFPLIEDNTISCCEETLKHENKEQLIKSWNEINNNFYHLFTVIFKPNIENNSIEVNLDSLVIHDRILIKKARIFELMYNDKLLKSSTMELFNMFPELRQLYSSLRGINIRKSQHSNCRMYKVIFDEILSRKLLQTTIKYMTFEKLKSFEIENTNNKFELYDF